MLKLRKFTCEVFQKGVRPQLLRFFFLHNSESFFIKILTEDEVHLQLGMRRQLGILDAIVKEIKTYKHFNCSVETVKIENLLTS